VLTSVHEVFLSHLLKKVSKIFDVVLSFNRFTDVKKYSLNAVALDEKNLLSYDVSYNNICKR
jgi:hypothetical protein